MKLIVCALALAGCADPVRFADRAILWQEHDDRPTPRPPRRPNTIEWAGGRDAIFLPADHALGLGYGREAENVNAVDEVPDSSWYHDPRRDASGRPRALTLEEAANGASRPEDEPVPPLTVIHGKANGSAAGFVVRDARGRQYMLKLDPLGRPGLVSSTETVASRLAWACGWRVPSERVIELRPEELLVTPASWTPDRYDRRVPLGAGAVAQQLREAAHLPDGRVRAVASLWIEGDLIGPFSYFGRDRRDLNDTVAHEDRRELRGFGVWASWVDDVDTMENNTLDAYVGAPGRGHVLHYQQDVGGSFGTFAGKPRSTFMGDETYFAPGRIFASLLTAGLIPRRWEGREASEDWPELGDFGAARFQPRDWHPILDNPAFVRQTERDRYWAAKRLAAFDAPELWAAIGAGRYRPEAAERLFAVLWSRRERILRAFFAGRTPPLDYFRFEGDGLCFDDLWLTAGLGGEAATRYSALETTASRRGGTITADRCVPLVARAGYRILELRVQRPGERRFGPPVAVHFIERGGRRRVVGVAR